MSRFPLLLAFEPHLTKEFVFRRAYAEELERNVRWLASGEVSGVDAGALSLAGHSMGGGAAINAAAALVRSGRPDLIKAVAAIAPWNGVEPTPSESVQDLGEVPLMVSSLNWENFEISWCAR